MSELGKVFLELLEFLTKLCVLVLILLDVALQDEDASLVLFNLLLKGGDSCFKVLLVRLQL